MRVDDIIQIKTKRRVGSASDRANMMLDELTDVVAQLAAELEKEKTERGEQAKRIVDTISGEISKCEKDVRQAIGNIADKFGEYCLSSAEGLAEIRAFLNRPRLFGVWMFDQFKKFVAKRG